jgi:tetratricopeptide (TPR) repeat protein
LCRIKRGSIRIAEKEVEFLPENYNAYYELSMFFYYKKNYAKSLYYINKSIQISPDYLRIFFENKRNEIVSKMEL